MGCRRRDLRDYELFSLILQGFSGLLRLYCVISGNSAGMGAGYAGSMTARRDAIGSTTARGDSVTAWARGDDWRLRGAGMHAPLILTANYGPGVAEKRRGLAGTGV